MASHLNPEQRAREHIDAMLRDCGWSVQSIDELNLHASLGVAVREMQSQGGPADYILFVQGKALGIVEAKKEGTTLSGVAEQSARYSHARKWMPQRWADPLPFTYETTGVETNFRDQRDPDSRSRPVFAFHTPEHLLALVQQPDTLRKKLRHLAFADPLIETGLRECQIDAVTQLERSLAANRPRALIQMATGSGKTFTAVTQAYRLIKHAGAKRILFLVDRGNLGRQTVREFQNYVTPDDGRSFTDLYNVQMLGPGGIDPVCKVTVSTIQRLYSQLSGKEDLDDEADEHSGYEMGGAGDKDPLEVRYNPKIPIESFDFVIVDECHRSIYNLWRQVLDYFDAFLIGLTATPSKATLGFFDRNLVTEYPYVQAVADGVNVGYDIYRIKTEVSEKGVTVKAGHDYQKRDRLTRAKRWEIQEAEETYQKTQLDRSVVVPDQLRTVIRTFREKLFTEIFPDRAVAARRMGLDAPWVPKTLIFAKDDSHAEDIVDIVRKEFGKGNDFCKKVTYRASGKSEDIIKAFRTAPEFRIAVTVDMIATGTDIKPLECLLFLRDVRSQLYFEQMKGRGTRTIDPDALASVTPDAGGKTRFVLVDAVGVTESDKTDSRPMESKPTVAFDKLLLGIAMGARDEATLTTVASRLARLDRRLSNSDREEISNVSGGPSVKQIAAALIKATDPDEIKAKAQTTTAGGEPTAAELKTAADSPRRRSRQAARLQTRPPRSARSQTPQDRCHHRPPHRRRAHQRRLRRGKSPPARHLLETIPRRQPGRNHRAPDPLQQTPRQAAPRLRRTQDPRRSRRPAALPHRPCRSLVRLRASGETPAHPEPRQDPHELDHPRPPHRRSRGHPARALPRSRRTPLPAMARPARRPLHRRPTPLARCHQKLRRPQRSLRHRRPHRLPRRLAKRRLG